MSNIGKIRINSSFNRRKEIIKDLVDEGIAVIVRTGDLCDFSFNDFFEEVTWQVIDKSKILGISTEQTGNIEIIEHWIRNNFHTYIRDKYNNLIRRNGC